MISRLTTNTILLSAIQLLNMIIPLLVYPLLIKTYGIETHSQYIFMQTVAVGFAVLVNFGTDISGTKLIGKNKTNNALSRYILLQIVRLRFLIFLGLTMMMVIVYGITPMKFDILNLVPMILVMSANFSWYFNAMNNLKRYVLSVFLFRVVYLLGISLICKYNLPFNYVVIVFCVTQILSNVSPLISVIMQRVSFDESFVRSKVKEESLVVFTGSFSSYVYSNGVKLAVGIVSNSVVFISYDILDKMFVVARMILLSFSNASFALVSEKRSIGKLNKMTLISLTLSVILSGLIYSSFSTVIAVMSEIEMTIPRLWITLLASNLT